jgi:hypothetical protein
VSNLDSGADLFCDFIGKIIYRQILYRNVTQQYR